MSIHRYRFIGDDVTDVNSELPGGATISVGAMRNLPYWDVDLSDDLQKTALDESLAARGWEFLQTFPNIAAADADPPVSPGPACPSFTALGVALAIAVPVFLPITGVALISALSVGAQYTVCRPSRLFTGGLSLRSSVATTVDVDIFSGGVIVASAVGVAIGLAPVVPVLSAFVDYPAGGLLAVRLTPTAVVGAIDIQGVVDLQTVI